MNCLIIDDDDLTRIDLEKKITKVSFLRMVGSCASTSEATDVLLNERVDLLLLDVMLPGISGLDFLNSLTDRSVQVILISSNKDFAVNAFEYSVVDFLVKPVSDERFLKAAMRAYSLGQRSVVREPILKDHLFVKSNGARVRIETENILFIEAQPDHLNIVTESGTFKVHSTLKSVSDCIPLDQFLRVHNSYIINLQKISGLEGNFLTIQKKVIPVSRSRQKELMSRLNLI